MFFEKLSEYTKNGTGFSIAVTETDEKLTVSIVPTGKNRYPPLIFTGTGAEIDGCITDKINTAFAALSGLVTNAETYEEKSETKEKGASKTQDKKEEKKEDRKSAGKSKPNNPAGKKPAPPAPPAKKAATTVPPAMTTQPAETTVPATTTIPIPEATTTIPEAEEIATGDDLGFEEVVEPEIPDQGEQSPDAGDSGEETDAPTLFD